MKLAIIALATLGLSFGAMAAPVSKTSISTTATAPASVDTASTAKINTPSTLAFNFVGLSQGKTNIYFDVGGISERVSPSLNFKTYSNKEKRKKMNNANVTVDRSLAGVGASFVALKADNKALIINPYLFFGTEKDAQDTVNNSGFGARLVGQLNFSKGVAMQVGIDGNNMEDSSFKTDVYVGVAFAL